MYYEENLGIILKFDESLYDNLKSINSKVEGLNKNKDEDLESYNFCYFNKNIEFNKIEENFFSSSLKFFENIENNSVIFFLEEIYFLFYIKNLEKFKENFVLFIFNDLYFFNNLLRYFPLKNIDFKKCFFIFPFTKFDKINFFLNEIISKIETNLIEEKLFEIILFFPFIDFIKRKFFINNIIKLLNLKNKGNNSKDYFDEINRINSELFYFYLNETKKYNINLEKFYINELLLKNSFKNKIIISIELLNLFLVKISDKKTYEKLIKNQIINILINLKYFERTLDIFPENPPYSLALVFGAGYSINKINIYEIKRLQKNGAAIIVVDTAYKYFIKNGITPDFVVILDSQFLNYYDFVFYPINYLKKRISDKFIQKNSNIINKIQSNKIESIKLNEIFLIEISSINKVSKVFNNINKIYFSSLLKDSNYSWVATNPLSFDLIKKLNINKLPSYGNVTLLSLTFSLLFFDNIYLFGFDSNFEKSIYHCKETLDYNYYLFREDYKNNLIDSLTKFCLNKKIDIGLRSSFELIKNKNIFENEFYKFIDRIKIDYFDLFKENSVIEKKFNNIEFRNKYFKEIERESLDNYKFEIKNLKDELEKIFFIIKFDKNIIINRLKELLNKSELFQKIIFSIYYFNENKRNLIDIDKKDLFLIKKLYHFFQR